MQIDLIFSKKNVNAGGFFHDFEKKMQMQMNLFKTKKPID